jgi:CHAD domain-containing protein/CYTH domain-containing protein
MIELNDSLLERSPEETSRYLCLGLLHEAAEALTRIEQDGDDEALHDFRVALRRLRSTIGTYRSYLKGSVKRKARERLKALAASTNAARDREVQVEWLSRAQGRVDPGAERGARFLLERLSSVESLVPASEDLRERFSGLRDALEKSLTRLRLRLDEEGPSFLSATGALVAEKAGNLEHGLRRVASADDGDELHRARIEAKRLRYLLEPLQAEVAGARALVADMKALQDILGDLQDARVLARTISDELERAAIEQAHRLRDLAFQGVPLPDGQGTAHPDLLALLRAQRERRDRVYEDLSRRWLPPASASFFREIAGLARRLSSFREPKHRRRYLLSDVPDEARRRTPRFVRQSFLPGRRIHEQVLAIRTGARSRYLRRTAIEGRSRTEEAISRDLFDALSSAARHRLERVRYQVREKGALWSIDELPERNLVLAEVTSDGEAAPPAWMEPVVLREVTGSSKYEWESLARRKVKRARSAPGRSGGPRGEAR